MVLSNPFTKSSKKKKSDNNKKTESVDSPPPSPKKSPTKVPRDRELRSDRDVRPDREPRPRPDYSSRSQSKPIGSPHYSYDHNSHPLNLPPHELRRLSAISAMSDPPTPMDIDQDQVSTSAPPSSPPPAFSATNGVNGDGSPMPPPHRAPTSPPPQPQPAPQPKKPAVDAEACKAAGNKFFKAKEYDKAIKEYTKGKNTYFGQHDAYSRIWRQKTFRGRG